MKNITKVGSKIVQAFDASVTCVTEDACCDDNFDIDDGVTIGDDHHKQQWYAGFEVAGVDHDAVKARLVAVFGSPTQERRRSDLPEGKFVNNWDVGSVYIVQLDGSIELFEDYRKVPARRKTK